MGPPGAEWAGETCFPGGCGSGETFQWSLTTPNDTTDTENMK